MNLKHKGVPNAITRRSQFESATFETEHDYEIEVAKLTDVLCKRLEDDARKLHSPRHSHIRTR